MSATPSAPFIAACVVLLVLLAVALLVIVDQRARLSLLSRRDSRPRRDHPALAFFVGGFVLLFILMLLATLAAHLAPGLMPQPAAPAPETAATGKDNPFHLATETDLALSGTKTACHPCHGDFPHTSKPMERAMLNMHTQFLGCMTCHFDRSLTPRVESAWLNYSGIEIKGQPYGLSTDSETGDFAATDDHFSKVVLYGDFGQGRTLIEVPADSAPARELLPPGTDLEGPAGERAKTELHRQLATQSPACEACHRNRETSLIPYEQLGFAELRITALTNLNLTGVFQKHDEFFLPQMFESEAPAEPGTGPLK